MDAEARKMIIELERKANIPSPAMNAHLDASSRKYTQIFCATMLAINASIYEDGEVETFHRPHLAKETKRYQVRTARAFLERIRAMP